MQETFHPNIGRPNKVIHVNLSYKPSVSKHGPNSSMNRSHVFNGDSNDFIIETYDSKTIITCVAPMNLKP